MQSLSLREHAGQLTIKSSQGSKCASALSIQHVLSATKFYKFYV